MGKSSKNILIPLDGSTNALKALDYLHQLYGSDHDLAVELFYVLPSLPSVLIDDRSMNKQMKQRKTAIIRENTEIAERILEEAKKILINKGLDEKRILTTFQDQAKSTAWDICYWANRKRVDAVLLTRRGRTQLDTIFLGGVSNKLINFCGDCPVWITRGETHSNKVLVCMDSSDNALRAAKHAAHMLSGTNSQITLYHTIRHLTSYIPLEAFKESGDIEGAYLDKEGRQIESYMVKAKDAFLDEGIGKEQVTIRVVDGGLDVANDILKEIDRIGYGTVVIGKQGRSAAREFIFGSVTNKILYMAAGTAIWIVQ